MKRRCIVLIALCAALYAAVRLWLNRAAPGPVPLFFSCYFSDVLAGIALPAVTSLLLLAAGRRPMVRWWSVALLLLAAGLVWGCLAPLWKPGAVFDWWDFAAYQLGGLLYWSVCNCKIFQKHTRSQ